MFIRGLPNNYCIRAAFRCKVDKSTIPDRIRDQPASFKTCQAAEKKIIATKMR